MFSENDTRRHNGCLPFLDVCIRRSNGCLSFTVYRKKTHTGRYLQYSSCHPIAHKRSVVSALITRAKRLCSNQQRLKEELTTVHHELSANGYPRNFVARIENQILRPNGTASKTATMRAAIPYVQGVSEALCRVFSKYDLRVAHVPSSKLRSRLVNVKDKMESDKFPGVVYKIPCADCDCVYIGETGKFSRRLKEHQRDVAKENRTTNALAEHACQHNHRIGWDDTAIIAKERNLASRLFLESLIIQTTPHTVNRTDGNMPAIYTKSLRHILHIN